MLKIIDKMAPKKRSIFVSVTVNLENKARNLLNRNTVGSSHLAPFFQVDQLKNAVNNDKKNKRAKL